MFDPDTLNLEQIVNRPDNCSLAALMIRHHEAVQQRNRLCEHISMDSECVRKSKM